MITVFKNLVIFLYYFNINFLANFILIINALIIFNVTPQIGHTSSGFGPSRIRKYWEGSSGGFIGAISIGRFVDFA